jgi:ribonuclease HI
MQKSILNPAKGIAVISDGSCWTGDKVGGWGYVAIDCFGQEIVGSGSEINTTVNRMEMIAIITGLEFIYNELGSCDILVYSDSEYVVLGFQNPSRKRKKNVDLWLKLDILKPQFGYVEFIHIRGHQGHFYNELADELAGNARISRQNLIKEL